jgi:cobalamin biosynthesis protein CobT
VYLSGGDKPSGSSERDSVLEGCTSTDKDLELQSLSSDNTRQRCGNKKSTLTRVSVVRTVGPSGSDRGSDNNDDDDEEEDGNDDENEGGNDIANEDEDNDEGLSNEHTNEKRDKKYQQGAVLQYELNGDNQLVKTKKRGKERKLPNDPNLIAFPHCLLQEKNRKLSKPTSLDRC